MILKEARGSSIQPRWSFLNICENYLDYASNISKGIYIYGSTLVNSNRYAGLEIQLQRYVDSCECWMNCPTYYWDAYVEDDFAEISIDNISVASGIYRFQIVHTAHDTSGLEIESFSANSNEIRIP